MGDLHSASFGAGLLLLLLSGCSAAPGSVELRADMENDRLLVSSAPGDADWSLLRISVDEPALKVRLNAEASRAEYDAEVAHAHGIADIRASPTPMAGTDFLDLCGEPFEFGTYHPTVRVIDNATKQAIFEREMANIDKCV